MPVRIIGSNYSGFISDAAAAVKYAVDNGANVLSNSWRVYKSWGFSNDESVEMLRAAIAYAGERNVIFVGAAGNESLNLDNHEQLDPIYPIALPGLTNMFLVAASDEATAPTYFTNYGARYVHVAAPGNNIQSTVPGASFEEMSGTSMATPLVAGAIARALSGGMSMEEAMQKLIATSEAAPAWTDKVQGGGVIRLVEYLAD
jgi:subtilisin family serine protease